jgi:hypothetical protein
MNLDNLVQLGVDHIDYQVSPKVEKKFIYQSLVRYGTTAIPMHMAIFNIPVTVAYAYNIPLIVWGENSANEYGGEESEKGFKLTSSWLKKFGVTHGTTAVDWVSEKLSKKELTPYFSPAANELEEKGVNAIFLGQYFKWDPETSLKVASAHGFKKSSEGVRTGYYDYADIDDDFISIHHYLKWYKFGFTRLFDNLSLEIRAGRMSRDHAIALISRAGDQHPRKDIEKLCRFIEITEDHFYEVIEPFRNLKIWSKSECWKIDNFLINDWVWR